MSIKFEFDQEGEEKPHYSPDDEWVCDCGFSLPCRRYSDWFGGDDLHREVVAEYLEDNKDGEQPLIHILFGIHGLRDLSRRSGCFRL